MLLTNASWVNHCWATIRTADHQHVISVPGKALLKIRLGQKQRFKINLKRNTSDSSTKPVIHYFRRLAK